MTEFRWAVDQTTGTFLYGGQEPYDCVPGLSPGQVRVVLSRMPNPATEKSDGGTGILPKTAQDLTDAATAKLDAQAQVDFDATKLFRAKAISDLAFRLGVAPGALTAAQISTERARIIAIYKSLP